MKSSALERGYNGLHPRTTNLSDESYLDFVETFRGIAGYGTYPIVAAIGDKAVNETLSEVNEETDIREIKKIINSLTEPATWQRIMRTHQEMMWRRTRSSFAKTEEQILQEMAIAEKKGPGKLLYDNDFVVPNYARREIHLQPGGYTEDPIGGIVYHYGTKIFYAGLNDQDQIHEEIVYSMKEPEDGNINKILDLACGIGQSTIILKKKYKKAEVTGLDVALPMLRYAHWNAVNNNIDVTYKQALSEDTKLEDDSFDMILSYILFHEIPVTVIKKTIEEMFRIIRPGGTFCIYEFPSAGPNMPPSQRWMIDYDSIHNCEPYSPGFVYSDFHKILNDSGFKTQKGPKNSNQFLQTIIATKEK